MIKTIGDFCPSCLDRLDRSYFLFGNLYDSRERKSFLAVLLADRLGDGPVATLHIIHHVPFSYHGWWSAGTCHAVGAGEAAYTCGDLYTWPITV